MAFTDCTADLFGAEARADGSILISSAVKGPFIDFSRAPCYTLLRSRHTL